MNKSKHDWGKVRLKNISSPNNIIAFMKAGKLSDCYVLNGECFLCIYFQHAIINLLSHSLSFRKAIISFRHQSKYSPQWG